MSLLDDVSIVVTPNGYKAGELYAVIPVPTLGTEELTCGNFECAVPTDYWTEGIGWDFIGGTANCDGTQTALSFLQQNGQVENGKMYQVTFDVVSITAGEIIAFLGGSQGTTRTLADTYTENFTATNSNFWLRASADFIGSIDNISVKEYTSADMDVTRATDATRVNESGLIEDVLANVPRIDYTGGGCPHILAEPERTNLITYSEDFTDSSWLKTSGGAGSNPIVTSSYATSPEGLVNASRIQFECGGVTSGDYSRLYSSFSLNGSSQYSQSFYIKSNTGSSQNLLFYTQNNDGDSITATTEWVRVDVQFTSNTTNFRNFGLIAKGSIQQTVDVSIYGASLEVGSYPTSLIPTSGSTVTRNQDIFTRDGIGSLINSTEGVLFVEIAAFADYTTYRYMGLTDGGSDNRVIILYYNSSTRIRVLLSSGGTKYFDAYYAVTSIEDFHKVALKWKENDFALWIDGVERATDTSGLAPIGLNTVALDQAGGDNFYGKVKQLQVYDTALTDEQLEALTT